MNLSDRLFGSGDWSLQQSGTQQESPELVKNVTVSKTVSAVDEEEMLFQAHLKLTRLINGGCLSQTLRLCPRNMLSEAIISNVGALKQNKPPETLLKALTALNDIAAGSPVQVRAVVQSGVVPDLINQLRSPYLKISEYAASTIANIVGQNSMYRDVALRLSVDAKLLPLIQSYSPESVLRNVSRAIKNLCHHGCGLDVLLNVDLKHELVPKLNELVTHSDPEASINALWTFIYLRRDDREIDPMSLDSKSVLRLVKLLKHEKGDILKVVLRTIYDEICKDDRQHLQAVIENGNLNCFVRSLDHHQVNIVVMTLRVVSVLTGTNNIEKIIASGIAAATLRLMYNDNHVVMSEAMKIVKNIVVEGTDQQVSYMIRHGIFHQIYKILSTDNVMHLDPEIIEVFDKIQSTLTERRQI